MFFKNKTPWEKNLLQSFLGNLGHGCLPYKLPGLSYVLLCSAGLEFVGSCRQLPETGGVFSRDLREINLSDIERIALSVYSDNHARPSVLGFTSLGNVSMMGEHRDWAQGVCPCAVMGSFFLCSLQSKVTWSLYHFHQDSEQTTLQVILLHSTRKHFV